MSVKVIITDEQKKVKLPTGTRLLIRKACIATLKMEGFEDSAEINVTLVNDDMIKEMNKKFRNIDSSTDVLSFPLGENGEYDTNPETGAKMLGDIVISVEHALSQANLTVTALSVKWLSLPFIQCCIFWAMTTKRAGLSAP